MTAQGPHRAVALDTIRRVTFAADNQSVRHPQMHYNDRCNMAVSQSLFSWWAAARRAPSASAIHVSYDDDVCAPRASQAEVRASQLFRNNQKASSYTEQLRGAVLGIRR
jgi:hypothetical protein